MWGAVIVMTPFESAVRGSLEGSHGGRAHVRDDPDGATALHHYRGLNCRGRPRTDIRTIVDAALYKTRTGIPWRELPTEFGSWQTALRRHNQLVASSQWDEITRTLAERDLPQ